VVSAIEFIDLKTQQKRISADLDRRMKAVLAHGNYIMGPEIKELEERLAAYAGVTHCIAVASGTDALLIALMALGVGPGDEVVTTPFTFIATAETIALLGAKPVFVDIDPETYNIDPELIGAAVTERCKAIVPVSLYGQCADFERINQVAERLGLPVIEDACQSFGATYRGKRSCALSSIGCTSFFPSKPLGCYGDAGACFTDSDELALKMRQIRVHGQERRYHHSVIGVNGRMDTLQAAVLLAKMEVFPDEVASRALIGARYAELLRSHVVTPRVAPENRSVFAQYTIQVAGRAAVQEKLALRGVPTAVHYPVPLHLQPAFARLGLGEGSFPVSEAASARVMSLPMHPYLSEDAQGYIADALRAALD